MSYVLSVFFLYVCQLDYPWRVVIVLLSVSTHVSPETLHDFRQSILLMFMQMPIGDDDGTEIKISNGRHV